MDRARIDVNRIAELGTRVGNAGAIRAQEQAADDTTDYIVALVILIESGGGRA